ncbi:MAG: hypothetical protein ICV83_09860 [Cytophagales bacterium]|nr:hypothetical protein [Cytophagales bacterium]
MAQEANILKVFNLGTSHEEDDMPDYPEGFPEVLKGYRHFGSLDHYQGYLYVPLSEKLGYKKKNPAYPDCIITVFNCQDLSLVAAAPLLYNQWVNGALQPVSDRSNAWCAINPLNGYLYVARFYETREPDEGFTLRVYKQELTGNQLHLEFVGEMPLYGKEGQPIFLKRVQGGTFSKNGHLYLVSDSHLVDNLLSGHFINGPSGVYAFDMVTGRNTFYIPIAPERNLWASEELESVALFTGSKYSGHVHILVLDNDMDEIGTDDISLIHFSVTPEDVDKL